MKICEANQDKNILRVNGKKQILIFYFSTLAHPFYYSNQPCRIGGF